MVGVGHVHGVAGEGDVARDRRLVERNGELLEIGDRDRVVLGRLEAESGPIPVAVLRGLDEVQASRIRDGDLAALLEDQREQLVDVALGGERHPDLIELAELLAPALVGLLDLPDRAAPGQGLDGPLQLVAQPHRGDRTQEQVVHEREPAEHRVGVRRVGDGHDRGLVRAARAQPGLDRGPLGLEEARVGHHQGGLLSVERRLQARERADLLGAEAGGQVPGQDVASFAPDQEIGHRRFRGRDEQSVAQGQGRRPSGS